MPYRARVAEVATASFTPPLIAVAAPSLRAQELHSIACSWLGTAYSVGIGVDSDEALSVLHHHIAASAGIHASNMALGHHYMFGEGTKCQAAEFFLRAAEVGSGPPGRRRISHALTPVSLPPCLVRHSFPSLAPPASSSRSVAPSALSLSLSRLPFDPAGATRVTRPCTQNGSIHSGNVLEIEVMGANGGRGPGLAGHQKVGKRGVNNDQVKHVEYLADSGNPIAMTNLGYGYLFGVNGLPQDYAHALR